MQPNANNFFLFSLPKFTLIAFPIFLVSAMFLYPGGTIFDDQRLTYSFTENYLSDSGRTENFRGEPNFFASTLFCYGLSLAGLTFIAFFYSIVSFFQESKRSGQLAILGAFIGILGSLCMIGVGFTPVDLYRTAHIFCANWLFRLFFVSSLCFSLAIYTHPTIPNKISGGYLVFSLLILSYVLIDELAPNASTSISILQLKVVAQKLIIIAFLIVIFLQSVGFKKLQYSLNKDL